MTTISTTETEKWQGLLQASKADTAAWADFCRVNEQRTLVCEEMVSFLKQYLAGELDTKALKETFQKTAS